MSERVPANLRARIRQRARQRCEYCLIHEQNTGFPHQPDHIIACKHGGETVEENLAWSCFLCNHLKGSDIASVDVETGRIVRLFHPRKDRWSRHFRLEQARIVPLTAVGRVTEYLLQFNHPETLEMRETLLAEGQYPG
jgi:HNH endonuclease